MTSIFMLAIKDLRKSWGLAVIMAILFALTFGSYLTLVTYEQSQGESYAAIEKNWLVVGSSDGLGEIYGSRIGTDVGTQLEQMGYERPIAEIRQLTGTSASTMILIRGMDLQRYPEVTPYKIVSGRALQPGDASHLAMVGEILARNKDLQLGGTVTLRGRKFTIIGIFQTGALEDNQVWISLSDAQNLLNYDKDVSVYFIPDDGKLKVGQTIRSGVSISQKGENGKLFDHSIQAFFRYMGMVAFLAGIATVITLINLLWRLAYLHRHEFGILKTLGFRLNAFFLYFGTQSFMILIVGLCIGLAAAFGILFKTLNKLSVFGYGLVFSWNMKTLLIMIALTLGIFLVGVITPLINIQRKRIPELLGRN